MNHILWGPGGSPRVQCNSEYPEVEYNTLLLSEPLRFVFRSAFLEVEWNGRCSTPMGYAGQLRPHRSLCDEEA